MTDSLVNNSSEVAILPCPFCGEVAKVGNKVSKDSNETYWVRCVNSSCPVYAETDRYDTEVEAIKAWNTRKKYYTPPKITFRGVTIDAIMRERTCEIYRVSNAQDIRKCSACGKQMHFYHPLDRNCLNYCPNCGAKVIS